ncbi:hypothetical protein DVH05_003603 [Phytophthora capsici]|nr:hypothetical protein DVH05_003603 [Phytophthora capsici]
MEWIYHMINVVCSPTRSPNAGYFAIISQSDKSFMLIQALTLLVVSGQLSVEAQTYAIFSSYLGDECDGTPYLVTIAQDDNCTPSSCSEYNLSENTLSANVVTTECSTDYVQSARDKFGKSPYLIQIMYEDENCTKSSMGYGYPATGSCVGGYNESESLYVIARLNENGSALFNQYLDRSCISNQLYTAEYIDKDAIANHSCDNQFRWYSSNGIAVSSGSGSTSEESGRNTSSGIGIALSALLLSAIFAVILIYMRRINLQSSSQLKSFKSASQLNVAIRGQSGLWNDDIITARRIPPDKVLVETLLSRGAFGEVYTGTFNGQRVAIKMLLPASREKLNCVNEFLAEAKMTATMDHPHIVSFIGVAWDSLSDLCVALEYMNGGELRTLLDKYKDENHPIGFNRLKTTIALQVCHALTYLHSLLPSVIHRDLKSRNILLDEEMKAKLSDFGISRAQLDRTMTAGVGTSLWMAPEVLLGERYDEKVDIFSFGVVLSELDLHSRPYDRVKKENLDSSGREMTESVLLEKVVLGHVQVEFSTSSPKEIAELGRACVSIDPTQRPSAAEALYRLQVILSRRI